MSLCHKRRYAEPTSVAFDGSNGMRVVEHYVYLTINLLCRINPSMLHVGVLHFFLTAQDHFEESQYESRRMDNLRKLKPNAIPTKFHFKKSKTLRQIVDNLTKTLHSTPLSVRHSVEHSYSQSSEKGPTEKEDNGENNSWLLS